MLYSLTSQNKSLIQPKLIINYFKHQPSYFKIKIQTFEDINVYDHMTCTKWSQIEIQMK